MDGWWQWNGVVWIVRMRFFCVWDTSTFLKRCIQQFNIFKGIWHWLLTFPPHSTNLNLFRFESIFALFVCRFVCFLRSFVIHEALVFATSNRNAQEQNTKEIIIICGAVAVWKPIFILLFGFEWCWKVTRCSLSLSWYFTYNNKVAIFYLPAFRFVGVFSYCFASFQRESVTRRYTEATTAAFCVDWANLRLTVFWWRTQIIMNCSFFFSRWSRSLHPSVIRFVCVCVFFFILLMLSNSFATFIFNVHCFKITIIKWDIIKMTAHLILRL